MSELDATVFDRLRAGLPPLDPTTELILRPDGDRPLAMLRPVGAPPRAFVLEADAVRELHLPDDPELPSAHLFADERQLAAALRDAVGEISEPRLIAWRPGRRAVLRMRCGAAVVFVKFLDRKTYKRAKATFAALATAPAPLQFARATAMLPEVCAYVAATAPGTPLRDQLARGITPHWQLVDASIRALAATPTAAGMPRHDFAAARAAAVKMLTKAAPLDRGLAAVADRIATMAPPAVANEGFVHGDLHDKQIFLTDTSSHLIDLEGIGSGDPGFDLVNLAEHLRLRSLQQSDADDGTADALLDRFRMDADARRRWRVCVRARLCGVYALRPRWSRLTQRLLSEVEGLLAAIS